MRSLTRSELLLDSALAALVFGGSLALLVAGTNEAGGDVPAAAVPLSALASLPLAARRRAPLPVFVLTALASSGVYAVGDPAGPPLGPTIALYFVAAHDSRAGTRSTLALVAAMLVVHLLAAGDPDWEILYGVLVWGGAWVAGDRTRLRRERIAQLEERAQRAEREAERERRLAAAEERSRIARDLHDSAGHAINVILVHAGLGRLQAERSPESAREAFATIEEVARETVGEIDQMVRALRDDGSRDGVEPPPGLAALEALAARHRAAGLRVTTSIRGERRPLPPAVDRGAYRILQEALTNAARHGSGSAEVEVAFAADALELAVDNPLGGAARDGGGHGVVGMRERATLLGGHLEAGARGGRFELRARLPLEDRG